MSRSSSNLLFARFFHRQCGRDGERGERELRCQLLAGAHGRVTEVRFYEHVRSRLARLARWQRRLDAVRSRMMGGCHTDRETLQAIAEAGFRLERSCGFGFPPAVRAYPVVPGILGLARVD